MDRVTHAYDGPLAVFLIGLRVHRPWKVGVVRRAGGAMPGMIAELERNLHETSGSGERWLGYLGSRSTVELFGVSMTQWWRSVDDIYAYANAEDHAHRPAWLEFYSAAKADPDAVTIWHETYAVEPGAVESLYAGPARLGLGTLAGTVPARRRGESARERLRSRVG